MRVFPWIALLLASCTPGARSCSARGVAPVALTSAEAHTAADSVDAFGAELHGALPKTGNLFYSPTSIAIALGMAERGASGATKAEMDKVLHLSGAPLAFAGIERTLSSSKSPEIAIADRLYADRSLRIEPAFEKLAPTETVDFVRDSEGTRGKINAWVSDRTHARIPELLAPGALDSGSRLVIVNAVYFKGAWATAFDRAATYDETFHAASDAKVPMMHKKLTAGFGAHAGAHVLDMPYRHHDGPELSMVVVLPDDGTSLAAVEAAYEKEGLAPFVSAASSSDEVDVTMPKTKMRTTLDLKAVLVSMGMGSAFADSADFRGVTRTEPVKIAKVVHQAYVDVNEEGTEAAAATGVLQAKAAAAYGGPVFLVDHPFLFFVRDRASGLVLFAGRCVDPRG
jgi:serpin B